MRDQTTTVLCYRNPKPRVHILSSMAATRISANLPPDIDPTKAPLAYGDRAIPKLNRELADNSLITRQRSLMALCGHLHDPEHITEAIQIGVVQSLKSLLTDDDGTIRHKATEVLYIIAGHNVGREAFLEFGIIPPLARLFEDRLDVVRRNSHMAVEMVSEFGPGADGVVQTGLIPVLVGKLKTELDEIKEYILDTLHYCLRLDQDQALKAGAMAVLTQLLFHESPIIRAKAARDVMDLSVPLAGKDRACSDNTLPALVTLLDDNDTDVRAKASGALMTISITTLGKKTAISSRALPRLVKLLNDPSSEVRLNALKAITMLSESPDGRQELLDSINEIKLRTHDQSVAVCKAAEIAVKVITWLP